MKSSDWADPRAATRWISSGDEFPGKGDFECTLVWPAANPFRVYFDSVWKLRWSWHWCLWKYWFICWYWPQSWSKDIFPRKVDFDYSSVRQQLISFHKIFREAAGIRFYPLYQKLCTRGLASLKLWWHSITDSNLIFSEGAFFRIGWTIGQLDMPPVYEWSEISANSFFRLSQNLRKNSALNQIGTVCIMNGAHCPVQLLMLILTLPILWIKFE